MTEHTISKILLTSEIDSQNVIVKFSDVAAIGASWKEAGEATSTPMSQSIVHF